MARCRSFSGLLTQLERCTMVYVLVRGPPALPLDRGLGGRAFVAAVPAEAGGLRPEAGRRARPQRRLDAAQDAFDLGALVRVEPALERRSLEAGDGVALAAELLDARGQVAALRPGRQLGQR